MRSSASPETAPEALLSGSCISAQALPSIWSGQRGHSMTGWHNSCVTSLEKNSNVQESLGEARCTTIPRRARSEWPKVAMFELRIYWMTLQSTFSKQKPEDRNSLNCSIPDLSSQVRISKAKPLQYIPWTLTMLLFASWPSGFTADIILHPVPEPRLSLGWDSPSTPCVLQVLHGWSLCYRSPEIFL